MYTNNNVKRAARAERVLCARCAGAVGARAYALARIDGAQRKQAPFIKGARAEHAGREGATERAERAESTQAQRKQAEHTQAREGATERAESTRARARQRARPPKAGGTPTPHSSKNAPTRPHTGIFREAVGEIPLPYYFTADETARGRLTGLHL